MRRYGAHEQQLVREVVLFDYKNVRSRQALFRETAKLNVNRQSHFGKSTHCTELLAK